MLALTLAVNKIILFIILLIVLVASLYLLFGLGKGTTNQLLLQHELSQCCGTYRAYGCPDDPSSVRCNSKDIDELRSELNIDVSQLKEICNC